MLGYKEELQISGGKLAFKNSVAGTNWVKNMNFKAWGSSKSFINKGAPHVSKGEQKQPQVRSLLHGSEAECSQVSPSPLAVSICCQTVTHGTKQCAS